MVRGVGGGVAVVWLGGKLPAAGARNQGLLFRPACHAAPCPHLGLLPLLFNRWYDFEKY